MPSDRAQKIADANDGARTEQPPRIGLSQARPHFRPVQIPEEKPEYKNRECDQDDEFDVLRQCGRTVGAQQKRYSIGLTT